MGFRLKDRFFQRPSNQLFFSNRENKFNVKTHRRRESRKTKRDVVHQRKREKNFFSEKITHTRERGK